MFCSLLFANDGKIIRVAGRLRTFIWPIQWLYLHVTKMLPGSTPLDFDQLNFSTLILSKMPGLALIPIFRIGLGHL